MLGIGGQVVTLDALGVPLNLEGFFSCKIYENVLVYIRMQNIIPSRTVFSAGALVITITVAAVALAMSAWFSVGHLPKIFSTSSSSVSQESPELVKFAALAPRMIYDDGCSDTDSGANFFQPGTVTAYTNNRMSTRTDSCIVGSTRKLIEYSCNTGVLQQQEYTCEAGCSSGACKKVGTVYVANTIDTEASPTSAGTYHDVLDLTDYKPGAFVDQILTPVFRTQYTDSFGGHPKISWLLLSNEGYCNSTQADCHAIHTAMTPYLNRLAALGDNIGWHYHGVDWSKSPDGTYGWNQLLTFNGTKVFTGETEIAQAERILASSIIQKRTYPTTFRSGWTWENTEYSNWLDNVFPFDFSNIAPLTTVGQGCTGDCETEKTVGGIGNIFDWSRAPSDWSFYHPSPTDYQTPGASKRWQFHTEMGWSSLDLAFARAAAGKDTLVTIYTHNYNGLDLQNRYLEMIVDAGRGHPNVPFKFVNALQGAQIMTDTSLDTIAPQLTVTKQTGSTGVSSTGTADTDVYTSPTDGTTSTNTVTVTSNEPLFSFPYGALRTEGKYLRLRPTSTTPVISSGKYTWTYDVSAYVTLDQHNVFVAGGTDRAGNGFVANAVAL